MIRMELRPVTYCDMCEAQTHPYEARCLECGVLICDKCEKNPEKIVSFQLHPNRCRYARFCIPCWEALSPDHPLRHDLEALTALNVEEQALDLQYRDLRDRINTEYERLYDLFQAREQSFRDKEAVR